MQAAVCKERYASSGMQAAVCKERYASSGMQRAGCKQRYAKSGMQRAVCKQRYASSGMQAAGCKQRYASSGMQGAGCKERDARSGMQGAARRATSPMCESAHGCSVLRVPGALRMRAVDICPHEGERRGASVGAGGEPQARERARASEREVSRKQCGERAIATCPEGTFEFCSSSVEAHATPRSPMAEPADATPPRRRRGAYYR